MAHPRDTMCHLPFIETWVEGLIRSSTVTSSKTLFEGYRSFVTITTSDRHLLDLVKEKRFYTQFRSIARRKNFEYIDSARGYRVTFPSKVPRSVRSDGGIMEKARLFVEGDERESCVRPIWIDKAQGHGLFATRDILCHSPVAEYIGQVISLEVATERDRQYAECGLDPRIITLPKQLAFDGYCRADGSKCPPLHNLGGLINHSRLSPNCKPVVVGSGSDTRIVMCTIQAVSSGQQFFWDYGDFRQGLPSWVYK